MALIAGAPEAGVRRLWVRCFLGCHASICGGKKWRGEFWVFGGRTNGVAGQVMGEGSDMSTMLEYKGYLGSVEYSNEDEVLHGRLEFIRDLVSYEGKDAKGIKAAFQEAVDDYLDLCEAEGRKVDVTR